MLYERLRVAIFNMSSITLDLNTGIAFDRTHWAKDPEAYSSRIAQSGFIAPDLAWRLDSHKYEQL